MHAGFFLIQSDYIHFLHGLAFVLMAVVLWPASREHGAADLEGPSAGPRPWRALALFGCASGAGVWSEMLAQSLGDFPAFRWFRVALLAVSVIFLWRFALSRLGGKAAAWAFAFLGAACALLVLAGAASGPFGAMASIRLGLLLPGGLAASAALWLRGRGNPGVAGKSLRSAALAMCGYALLAGGLTPGVPWLPVWFPAETFFVWGARVPVQPVRTLLASGLALSVWMYFSESRAARSGLYSEQDAKGVRRRERGMLFILAAILSLGWLSADFAGNMGLSDNVIRYGHQLGVVGDNLSMTMRMADRVALAAASASRVSRAMGQGPEAIEGLNEAMDRFASIIPGASVSFMNNRGVGVAASTRGEPTSTVGHNLAFRPYFQDAMRRGTGALVAVGSGTWVPGYYTAARVTAPDGSVSGVVAVKVVLAGLPLDQGSQGPAYLVDRNGIVLASNVPEHFLHQLWPADPEKIRPLLEEGTLPAVFPPIFPAVAANGEYGLFSGIKRVVVRVPVGGQGLELVLLASLEPLWLPRLLVIAITMLISVLLLATFASNERMRADAARLANRNRELDAALVRAEEAGKAKSMFLANMSHEIRTPLNGVLGMLGDLEESALTPGQAEDVRVALEAGRNLLRVVGDILDFSKIEAGKMEIRSEPVALVPMIEAVAAAFAPEAARKGLRLESRVDPQAPGAFLGDEVRIRQVLYNLVGNATKFTRQGEVRLDVDAGEVSGGGRADLAFSVSDTGDGIPEGKQRDVFEAFTQVDGSATRTYQGTGLGLTIVRELVRAMGGDVSLESAPGQGPRIRVTLPVTPCEPPRLAPSLQESFSDAPERGLNILLAEDDRINQITARRFLEKWGHAVTLADNGRQALEALKAGGFDVVLMDMHMPVLDGLSAVRAIRSDPEFSRHSAMPIVALTANAMKGDRERYLSEGLDGYLSKPIDPAEMRRVLRAVVRDRG